MDAYAFASQTTLDDCLSMLDWWKTKRGVDAETSAPDAKFETKQPLLVVLLDDLVRGATVKATVLEPRTNLNETQVITALGSPGGGYMRWGFKPSTTAAVEWSEILYPTLDTADVIERKLTSGGGSLSLADVTVQLGYTITGLPPDQEHWQTWRWQVTFGGRYAGLDVQPLEIDDHLAGATVLVESVTDWEDTGRIVDVREVIGVPFPTPLKAGARAWVQWKSRAGWCVIAVEPRDFGDYGLY